MMPKPIELLIFEQDPNVQGILRSFLAPDRFQLRFVEDKEAVLDLVQNRPIDVLIMNLLLSDGNGLQACRQVRKASQKEGIKIIVCSFLRAEDWALEAGASAFIQLPYSRRQLLSVVDRVTKSPDRSTVEADVSTAEAST